MDFRNLIRIIVLAIPLLFSCGCERPPESSETALNPKKYEVAVLLTSDMYLPLSAAGLKEGMRELSYQDGKDIEYTVYNAAGDPAKLTSLAGQAVQANPDVICPSTISAIDAVKATGTNLPVVFLESMYPVEFGLVKSLVRPGTNYTGVSNMTGPMSGKRLELLVKIDPQIKRVAVICNPDNKVAGLSLEATKAAALDLGLQLDIHAIYNQNDLEAAIEKVRRSPADALVLNPDFMVFSRLAKIISMAKEKKIPTMGIDASQAEQGILVSYGGGLREIARQAARHVDRVLQGESPAGIPVEAPREYHLFVNLKTAEEIGRELPPEILYQAKGYYR